MFIRVSAKKSQSRKREYVHQTTYIFPYPKYVTCLPQATFPKKKKNGVMIYWLKAMFCGKAIL